MRWPCQSTFTPWIKEFVTAAAFVAATTAWKATSSAKAVCISPCVNHHRNPTHVLCTVPSPAQTVIGTSLPPDMRCWPLGSQPRVKNVPAVPRAGFWNVLVTCIFTLVLSMAGGMAAAGTAATAAGGTGAGAGCNAATRIGLLEHLRQAAFDSCAQGCLSAAADDCDLTLAQLPSW